MPLRSLAYAFARFGTGRGVGRERAAAAARLRAACARKPWYVAGSVRFCTEIMERFGARVFVKTGAEGVYCAALPELGLGIAIKCDDGAARAAQVIVAALVARFLALDEGERAAIASLARPELRNWNGITTGMLRATDVI
jgi:L-asparaginase II